jgi:fermentation-respiration switch protein FrsA (DUF1100 family)
LIERLELIASDTKRLLAKHTHQRNRTWQTVILTCLGACLTVVAIIPGGLAERLFGIVVGSVLTGGVVLLWSQGTRSGGWVALALGAMGVIVGIGIGLRSISVGVIDVIASVSTLALFAGVAAVGIGLGRVATGLRRIWRIAAETLLAVFVALTVWTVTPALIATNVPRITPGDATPADFGFEASEVQFDTSDGVRLWAWFAPPSDGKVAIIRHGAGSTASDALSHAATMVRHGYGVLITDARGHGHSGGEAMDFGWYGDLDIGAAVDFLLIQPGVDPNRIVLVGLSMGGEESIGAAAADSRVAAVVAEGVTARTDADKAWLAEEYGWRGWVQTKLEWVQYTVTDLLTDASKPASLASAAAAMAPRELLLVTAGAVAEEGNAARHIEASGPGNVTVRTIAGAGHIQGLRVAPDEWQRAVIDFLDSALSRAS